LTGGNKHRANGLNRAAIASIDAPFVCAFKGKSNPNPRFVGMHFAIDTENIGLIQ
jgi:hypothetical protein